MGTEEFRVDLDEITEALSSSGRLASSLPRFAERDGQIKLAVEAGKIIDDGGIGVFEAGTGIGKTYAYLTPILQSGAKAVISTSTKALQDQIVGEDLPLLAKALGKSVDARLLKGRANYICRRRLDESLSEGMFDELALDDADIIKDLSVIAEYSAKGGDGDRSGIKGVSVSSQAWPLATSTESNCTKGDCKNYRECFFYQARRKALEADVVVVNHALLLADAMLHRESNNHAGLLPQTDVLVIDEAHVLPSEMQKQFGVQLSMNKINEMALGVQLQSAKVPDGGGPGKAAAQLKQALAQLRRACVKNPFQPCLASKLRQDPALSTEIDCVTATLRELNASLSALSLQAGDDSQTELLSLREELEQVEKVFSDWLDPKDDVIAWCEMVGRGVLHLQLTPMETAEIFRNDLNRQRSCLLLSATLSVAGGLGAFKNRLGILDGTTDLMVESPFDYEANSMLVLPEKMPDPARNDDNFRDQVADTAARLIEANKGRAFLLFTSWRALEHVQKRLKKVLDDDYELLVQGSESPERLLRRFRSARHGQVLLGTRTFWQGVDVAGDQLSLVLIDKVPFPPPNDPILESQKDLVEEPFDQLWLLPAALLLKQAAGRLIRSETDRGVLVICDPRMKTKRYGQKLIKTLPKMKLTRKLPEASSFLRGMSNES